MLNGLKAGLKQAMAGVLLGLQTSIVLLRTAAVATSLSLTLMATLLLLASGKQILHVTGVLLPIHPLVIQKKSIASVRLSTRT